MSWPPNTSSFHFKKLGLKPAFPLETKDIDGTPVSTAFANYRQPFQLGSNTKAGTQECDWKTTGEPVTLRAGTDFSVLSYSGNAEANAPPGLRRLLHPHTARRSTQAIPAKKISKARSPSSSASSP